MATNTNIIEFAPSHGALAHPASDTAIESGQRRPPETSTTASTFEALDFVFSEAPNKGSRGLRLSTRLNFTLRGTRLSGERVSFP